jgi:tRNA 2-thiouridine synthesizing protein A
MSSVEVDARNLLCPMPVIRAQNAIENLAHGTRVIVHCTDPGALHDIPAWCRIHGHKLIEVFAEDRVVRVEIEVVRDDS